MSTTKAHDTSRGELADPGLLPRSHKKDGRPNSGPAGYVPLEEAVTLSASFEYFTDSGQPRGEFALFRRQEKALVEVGGRFFVPLTKEERQTIETKAVPTLGAGVIEPDRLSIVPQVLADQPLRVRDAIRVGRTSTGSVSYIREESYTEAAGITAPGNLKPESTVDYTEQTVNVHVLAVWMPVQTQQLADFAQLRGLIQGRLTYDVRRLEEREIVWGAGGAAAFEGLLTIAGTHDISALPRYSSTADTLIDAVKMGATEIRAAGYEPDTLLVHPADWEEMLLEKGSDGHFLGQGFPSADGAPRLWGLRVIESTAVEDSATGERHFIVLDSRRAAELWIREDLSILVGMQNDDLTRNLRTLLAEERAAFGVVAPAAIAELETVAATT